MLVELLKHLSESMGIVTVAELAMKLLEISDPGITGTVADTPFA